VCYIPSAQSGGGSGAGGPEGTRGGRCACRHDESEGGEPGTTIGFLFGIDHGDGKHQKHADDSNAHLELLLLE